LIINNYIINYFIMHDSRGEVLWNYPDFENKFLGSILETQDLGEYKLVVCNLTDNENNNDITHNVSIGIASAITAYARIHMSKFKIILKLIYIILIQIVLTLIQNYLNN